MKNKLIEINDYLSRKEMRLIMGGYIMIRDSFDDDGHHDTCNKDCNTNLDCDGGRAMCPSCVLHPSGDYKSCR